MSSMHPLARMILEHIPAEVRRTGHPPTIREMAESFGFSPTAIVYHLKALREAGLVDWDYSKPRTVRLTKEGRKELHATPADDHPTEPPADEPADGERAE